MQLNPSAVLVPCVFPATGQGGLYGTAGMRRAGRGSPGDRGPDTMGVQRWLRGSTAVADITPLVPTMSCVLAALIALMQKAAQPPRAVPSPCQPQSPGGKAATCGALVVWRGLEVLCGFGEVAVSRFAPELCPPAGQGLPHGPGVPVPPPGLPSHCCAPQITQGLSSPRCVCVWP